MDTQTALKNTISETPCVRIHVASPSWGKLESKQGAGKRNQWPVIQKNVRHPC